MDELLRALGAIAEPPQPEHARIWPLLGIARPPDPVAYTDAFVFQLFPYASVYLGAEGMLGGEARDRIAGFLRALGAPVQTDPDHLAALLGTYAQLVHHATTGAGAGTKAWRRARDAFLWEHLLSWLPGYLARVAAIAPDPYPHWAQLLDHVLVSEAARSQPPALLPLHLRAAPTLPDPRDSTAPEFLNALLAPVRTGLVLTRSDLARAARALGLGLRIGERRYVLSALLDQNAPAVLRWLAAEASAHATAWNPPELEPVASFWRERTQHTADLLQDLASDVSEVLAAATT